MDLPNINLSKYRDNVDILSQKVVSLDRWNNMHYIVYIDLERLTGNLGQYFKTIGYLNSTLKNSLLNDFKGVILKTDVLYRSEFWVEESFKSLFENIRRSFPSYNIISEYSGSSVSLKLRITLNDGEGLIDSDLLRGEIESNVEIFLTFLLDELEQVSLKNKSILSKEYSILDDFDIQILKIGVDYYEDVIEKRIDIDKNGYFNEDAIIEIVNSINIKLNDINEKAYKNCKSLHSMEKMSWNYNILNFLNTSLTNFLKNSYNHPYFYLNDENAVLNIDDNEENHFIGRGNISLERLLELSKRVSENNKTPSFNKFMCSLKEIKG